MDQFSISQLAVFSGIKPHTIRMWEQRYGAFQPNRSSGNTRYYDNMQLRRLLNIVSLLEAGHKVSELCVMTDRQLSTLLRRIFPATSSDQLLTGYFINQLIAAAINYDEASFEKVFSHSFLHNGLKHTFQNILYPVLNRLGLMWAYSELPPVQEHFFSNLIRQKLFTAVDSVAATPSSTSKWLLFLPEGEFHDIGLLLAHFLIKQAGHSSVFIGSNLPVSSLDNAVKAIQPQQLLLFFVHNDFPESVRQYVLQLSKKYNGLKIFVAGRHQVVSSLPPMKNVRILNNMEDLEQELQNKLFNFK